jgi:undecaprenyl-diphosphatase
MQYFFGIDDPQVSFIVALHLGSLLAVIVYFWRDWMNLIGVKKDMDMYRDNPRLLWYIIIATVPAAAIGLIFNERADQLILSPVMIAALIVIGSGILFIADRFFVSDRDMKKIRIWEAVIIGMAQIAALIPGISRSGMTIAGARVCKLDRVSAARFSFLISTPVIFGAGIMEMKDMVLSEMTIFFIIGALVSFISAFATIHYFLVMIQKISYAIFLYYSVIFFVIVALLNVI